MISRNRSNSGIDRVGVSSPFLALRLMRPGTALSGFVDYFHGAACGVRVSKQGILESLHMPNDQNAGSNERGSI
jgi:hypothetical protein